MFLGFDMLVAVTIDTQNVNRIMVRYIFLKKIRTARLTALIQLTVLLVLSSEPQTVLPPTDLQNDVAH
jgi:hypothetical protein